MPGGPRLVEIRPHLFAHASGAIWVAASRTMLVADLHLGYSWAQRRRGELGPLTTGGVEERLLAAIEDLRPVQLVVLGDLVHAPRPSAAEFSAISETLYQLRQRATLTLVAGNHDRGLARDFGVAIETAWRQDDLLAVHGDVLPDAAARRAYCIYGHWHPTVLLKDAAGVNTRYAAFLCGPRATVMPAFSPFSRGLDIRRAWPAALREALGTEPARIAVASGKAIRFLGTNYAPRQRPVIAKG